MIRLATLIDTFATDFLTQYSSRLLPEHLQAMAAIKRCRTESSLKMQVQCTACAHQRLVPHSCGHRYGVAAEFGKNRTLRFSAAA